MSNVFRTAAFAVIPLCLAAGAAATAQQVAEPDPAFSAPHVEPLPSAPAIEATPEIILPMDTPESEPELSAPVLERPAAPAATLSQLVARHAAATAADRETDCLARAVYFESKGEPLAGRLAVAQVVLNRASSGRFPGTICGVVKQPSQFSFVRGGAFPAIREPGQWREAVAIAHIAVNDMWKGPAPNALYFHAKRVSPNWNRARIASVGNHVFYR